MPYLVDGHNLIPKLGLRLESADDEMELVAVLQEFARLERREVEVYFDGAPAGHAGTRKLGALKAHFVRLGQSADSAMRARLQKMGRSARNWTVVSSDHEIRAAAHAAQAGSLTSEEFVKLLRQVMQVAPKPAEDKILSKNEVDDWMKLFGDTNNGKNHSEEK
jgi:predicted RNA-binding protein with PIN domain